MHVHAAAFRGLVRHWPRMLLLLAAHISARALACLPFWIQPFFPHILLSFFSKVLLCFSAYVLFVYPLRFITGVLLSSFVADKPAVRAAKYPQLVLAGMIRMAMGGIWGLPFMACIYEFYLYVFIYEASRAGDMLARIGGSIASLIPFASPHALGLAAVLFIIVASLFLLLYGWHRGVCYDFQLKENQDAFSAFREARRTRKMAKGGLRRNALIHFLLLVPPMLAFCCVMTLGLKGFSQAVLAAQLALSAGVILEPVILIRAVFAFMLLYLPLVLYRKARNAAVVVNYEYIS